MGAVFQGLHPGTGKAVALKVILGEPSRQAAVRLIREARLLSRVRHPSLVEVYDCGIEEGNPWVLMELVEGEDLELFARKSGGRLGAQVIEPMLRQVASVLSALNRAGIVHRDIKPQNIMRTRSGRFVVMDLGLAVSKGDTRYTATGALVGTLPYMAPEMWLSHEEGPSLDWYALGVTVLRLHTGHYPFSRDQIFAMSAKREWNFIPKMGEDFARSRLGWICRHLLEADPRRRITSEEELVAALATSAARVSKVVPALPPWQEGLPRAWLKGALLLCLCLGGVVLGVKLAKSQNSPRNLGFHPAVTPQYKEDRAWRSLLGYLDLPVVDRKNVDPALFLDAMIRRGDRESVQHLEEFLDTQPPGPRSLFLRMRILGERGDHAENRALAALVDLKKGPLESYLDARLMVEALGERMLTHLDASGSEVTSLKEMVHALDRRLAGQSEIFFQSARVELWGMVAHRACPRPRFNLPAMERCEELGTRLLPQVKEMPPFARLSFLLEFLRSLLRLGERERCSLFLQRFQKLSLAPLLLPSLMEAWKEDIQWETRISQGLQSILSPTDIFTPDMDASWIPTSDKGYLLPDPSRPLLEFRSELAPTPLEALQWALDESLLFRKRLVVAPEWLEQHLSPRVLQQKGDLRKAVLRSPSLVKDVEYSLEREGLHQVYLDLLHELDRRNQGGSGSDREARRWYRGRLGGLVQDLLEYEARVGDAQRGWQRVQRHLLGFARLPAPWRVEEVRGILSLLRRVRFRRDRDNRCMGDRANVLRVGILLLRGILRDPGVDRERVYLKVLQDLLWDWGISLKVNLAWVKELCTELVDQLTDEDPKDIMEVQQLIFRIKAERVRVSLSADWKASLGAKRKVGETLAGTPCHGELGEGIELFSGLEVAASPEGYRKELADLVRGYKGMRGLRE
jgi:serine/threonine protein kinase